MARPRKPRVVTRWVVTRAHSEEEAHSKAVAARNSPAFSAWDRVEVCYNPQVDVPQSVKGPWSIEYVRDGYGHGAHENQLH